MSRYIDADALKERLEDFSKWCRDGRKQGVDFVLDCPLPNMPTADVAPRAEVAREIFEELRRYIINHCYLADDDVDAIWKHIDIIEKKYTEEQ